jgi:hypothetical protein
MMRHSHQLRYTLPFGVLFPYRRDGLEDISDGCEDHISQWLYCGVGVH